MLNSPTPVSKPRAELEYSSAFLLVCAAFWVLAGTMSYLWGSSLAAGLIMIFLAIVFGISSIARSTKPQAAAEEPASDPPPTGLRRMWFILAGLILLHGVVAIVICRHWLPLIDTYTFQREACKNLLRGIDPFGATQADIYGPRYDFYGPGMVVDGRVQVGFQYPPLTLFWALPGYLLGDVRYSYILAVMISAVLLFAMVPNSRSLRIAALLLLNPLTFFVEIMSWTEPLVLLTLSATLYAAIKTRWWLPIALGLFLASKQYNVLALPFLAGLVQPLQWKSFAKLLSRAVLVAAATVLPFALWNFRGLWRDVVLFHLAQPFRPQSLSFAVPYPIFLFLKIGPVLLLIFIVWATMKRTRNPAMFAAGYGVSLLLLFSTSKQAFCNYYFLIAQAFLLAVAALPNLSLRPRAPTIAKGFASTSRESTSHI
ncbi:MAG: hypothetical protein WBD45_23485 [Terriglobales bacterium]